MTGLVVAQWLFWLAAGVIVYTFVGYPALAWLWAKLRPLPVRVRADEPPVTLILVAYNEAEHIEAKLANCLNLAYPQDRLRVLVVLDGATDGTDDLVRRYRARNKLWERVQLLAYPQRRGKAACLNDAVAAAGTEHLVLADVRQRLAPDAVQRLMAALADPAVGAASGELVFEDDRPNGFSQGVDAYWRYEKFLRRQESASGSVVGVTGALYALKRSAYQPIPAGTILDDVLIPLNAALQGYRVVFVPQALAIDRPARDPGRERARKIRTIAGNYQLLQYRPLLLHPLRNPLWFRLVSHKLLRLAAPVLLAVLFAANVVLLQEGLIYQVTLTGQVAVYGITLLSRALPGHAMPAPLRISTAFCFLNWFAVLGLLEFLRNKKIHLW